MTFDRKYWLFEEKVRDYKLESLKECYEEILSDIETIIGDARNRFLILDVGCGYGYFLQICVIHGFRCIGIDISQYALRKLKESISMQAMLSDVELGIPLRSNSVDIIVMLEVIEHLYRPARVLQEISRVLKPNGILYVTTPNRNALGRLIFRDKWYGLLDKTHRILFTTSSLRNLIEKEGFKVIKIYEPFHISTLRHIHIFSHIGLGGQIRILAKKT